MRFSHKAQSAYNVSLLPRSLDTFQCHTYSAKFPLPEEHSLPKAACDTMSYGAGKLIKHNHLSHPTYRVPIYASGSRAAMWIKLPCWRTKVHGDGGIRTRGSHRESWVNTPQVHNTSNVFQTLCWLRERTLISHPFFFFDSLESVFSSRFAVELVEQIEGATMQPSDVVVEVRTASEQALFQLAALAITIVFAIVTGIITGLRYKKKSRTLPLYQHSPLPSH